MTGYRQATACLIGMVASLAAGPARAEAEKDGLSLNGSLRLRAEAISGQARAGGNSDDKLAETRLILRAGWKQGPVRIVAELHDSRAWGANPGTPLTTGEVNTLEPVQAYIEGDLGDVLGHGTKASLRAGRMTLSLGSTRLVASDDYRNTTNGFTGIRADASLRGGYAVTAIYVLPLLRLPDDGPSLRDNRAELDKESFDAVLWGGFLSRQRKGEPLLVEAGFVHFGERDAPGRPTRDRSLNSASFRVQRGPKAGAFDWGGEVIYQWGGISASAAAGVARLPVSATNLHLQAGYSFPGPWKPHLQVEFDRASGDGPSNTYGRFDPLFGARRFDLAPAGLYSAVSRSNLLSPGVRLEVTPSKRVDAMLVWRGLWLADRHDAFSATGVRDVTGRSGNFAGHQIDARLRYWLVPGRLRFEADGVLLAKGGFLRHAPNAMPGATTRYGSLNLSAMF